MPGVQCAICQEDKPINDCWCVIDSKTKSRYYECKKKCKASIPLEIEIPSNMIMEDEQGQEQRQNKKVIDFIEEPPKGLLQRAIEWFSGNSDGYTKMKVE